MHNDVERLKKNIKDGKISLWSQVHDCYRHKGADYSHDKLIHAYTSLLENENITSKQFTPGVFNILMEKSFVTKTWMSKGIFTSREKDYKNPFRKMVYDTTEEMNSVIGKLEDNRFIQDQFAETDNYKKIIDALAKKFR